MKRALLLLLLVQFSFIMNSQDDCFTAIMVEPGTYTVDFINGTAPITNCVGGDNAAHGEWYVYMSDETQQVTVSTDLIQNSGIDTRVNVYQSGCDFLTCLGGDDDGGSGYLSTFTFNAQAFVTYHIVFDDRWTQEGFDFTITEALPGGGELSFTEETLNQAINAIVDMDGDMLDDLVTAGSTSISIGSQLLSGGFNYETYTFPSTANNPSWSLAAADYDENGFTDLLYGGGTGVSFLKRSDDGSAFTEFTSGEYVFSQRSNFVDIDNDGALDAFVCHDVAPNVFYLNDGSGALTHNQGGLGDTPDGGNYGSVWIDYDNDCDMDLFLAKCRGAGSPASINQLHRNNGDGTYTEVGTITGLDDGVQTWSSAWGDYDNDGDMDVFVGASSTSAGSHKMMENNGDGTFTDITEGTGFENLNATGIENACADFNNDGWIDIFGAGSTIMLNNGDWTFTPIFVGFSNGSIGDLNDDGFLDIARSSIYYNDGNDNNFLKVHTQGVVSNLEGIGCRVTLSTANGNQIREIRSGEGFRYMSSLNAHFGIGEEEAVLVLKVHWPSGIIDVIENPEINTTINVIEGSTVVGIDEEASASLTLSPNPARDILRINSDQLGLQSIATVFDLTGKRVLNERLTGRLIDISRLSPGAYILRLESEGKFLEKKFNKY